VDRRAVLEGSFAIMSAAMTSSPRAAEPMMIEDFTNGDGRGWRYVSDRVMGGVSDGSFQIVQEGDSRFARLSGTVSTANNGGFIQMRRALQAPLPQGSTGLALRVRGNGERYTCDPGRPSARGTT